MTKTEHSRVALITGASRGIGAHIARALASEGWSIAALARSESSLSDVASAITEAGSDVMTLACEVTDVKQVTSAVGTVLEQWGRIDLLVNNAGLIEPEVALWDADPEQWWQVIETNVRGPFLMSRAVVPAMIAAGGGRIVNMNSGAGTKENGVLSAYTASKSALARITGAVAVSAADDHVFAFDLAPGVVATDMTASMDMHRGRTDWTDPGDVTGLLSALASGDLDAFSGCMVRAGVDTVEALKSQAEAGLSDGARMLRLRPWGEDDPVAK
ncbi:SDR family oxidoreductase [Ornithinimicrobium sp. Arc0846-15]|nr:SDR family oxidoreductase [Ornithinimicrobium laminariae]